MSQICGYSFDSALRWLCKQAVWDTRYHFLLLFSPLGGIEPALGSKEFLTVCIASLQVRTRRFLACASVSTSHHTCKSSADNYMRTRRSIAPPPVTCGPIPGSVLALVLKQSLGSRRRWESLEDDHHDVLHVTVSAEFARACISVCALSFDLRASPSPIPDPENVNFADAGRSGTADCSGRLLSGGCRRCLRSNRSAPAC